MDAIVMDVMGDESRWTISVSVSMNGGVEGRGERRRGDSITEVSILGWNG